MGDYGRIGDRTAGCVGAVGWTGGLTDTALALGATCTAVGTGLETDKYPVKCATIKPLTAVATAAAMISKNFTTKREK